MKTRSANKPITLLLSVLLCTTLALIQVPWTAYAIDEDEMSADLTEPGADEINDDSLELDGLDEPDDLDKMGELGDEEEASSDEFDSTLVGDVIRIATHAAESEDEGQEDDALVAQADDDIASGTAGECNWVIDANGVLTITPGTGNHFQDFGGSGLTHWYQWRDQIVSVQIPEQIIASYSVDYMFYECLYLQSLDLTNLDTSEVHDMHWMFAGCASLTSIDLTGFDTSKVEDMDWMFAGCASLTSIDLTGFDTSNVLYMGGMFEGCLALDEVKLGDTFSFKGANGISGAIMTTLPEGNWMSTIADANQIFSPDMIAEDRNDLADTYLKVSLVKDVRVSSIDAPAASAVVKPVNLTLQAADGALASNAASSSWQGDFAKDSDGSDIFVAGNTYTLSVNVPFGNRSVRDNGFALSAPNGFTVTPGAFNGSPVGPAGQTYTFTLSYTVPPAGDHVVALDPGNGDAVSSVNVVDGEKLQRPADPIREGYVFDGWLLDGEPYDFDAPVTSNMTLTAKWTEQKPVVLPDEPNSEPEPEATPDEPEPEATLDEPKSEPAPSGLPPRTMDIIGGSMSLVLLACVLSAAAIGINRRKAYEAIKSHFHYERYGYLSKNQGSLLRRPWR